LTLRILREAWPIIIGIGALGFVLALAFSVEVSLPAWVAVLVVVWFHRDPDCPVPADPLAVVSPISGVVVTIETADDPMLKRPAVRLQIRKNLFNTFQLRSPTEGKIQGIKLLPEAAQGKAFVPYAVWIQTDELDNLILVAESARLMRRPRLYLRAGERIGQGQRFGYVPFGRRFDIYLHENSRIDVKSREHVKSGTTVLGHYTHK